MRLRTEEDIRKMGVVCARRRSSMGYNTQRKRQTSAPTRRRSKTNNRRKHQDGNVLVCKAGVSSASSAASSSSSSPSPPSKASKDKAKLRQEQQQPRRRRERDERGRGPSLRRSQIVDKDVIARRSGKRLGRVATLLCAPPASDGAPLRVCSLAVTRGAPLLDTVEPREVALTRLRQLGDVALVEDGADMPSSSGAPPSSSFSFSSSNAASFPSASAAANATTEDLVGKAVVTEGAEYIGRVRDLFFDPEDGRVQALVADELDWLPRTVLPPENVVSTYRIDAGEVLAVAPDRVIVAAGAERRIETLSIGILKQIAGLSQPSQQQQQREAQQRRQREQDAAAERGYYDYQQDEYVDEDISVAGRNAARRQARAPAMNDERDVPAKRAGIPIVSGAPPPYRRRDADGGLGERPEPRPVFDEWVERDADERPADALMEDVMGAAPPRRTSSGAMPSVGSRRQQSSSYDPNEDRL